MPSDLWFREGPRLVKAQHAVHVIIAVAALIYVDVQAIRFRLGPAKRTGIDVSAIFWHFLGGKLHSGNHSNRFSHSEASEASQMTKSSSIAVPMSRVCAIRNTPALRFPSLRNLRKWAGMVAASWETSTRWCSAAPPEPLGSVIPRNPAAWAARKSMDGSRRRTPLTMALLRSASARKRTLTSNEARAVHRERA